VHVQRHSRHQQTHPITPHFRYRNARIGTPQLERPKWEMFESHAAPYYVWRWMQRSDGAADAAHPKKVPPWPAPPGLALLATAQPLSSVPAPRITLQLCVMTWWRYRLHESMFSLGRIPLRQFSSLHESNANFPPLATKTHGHPVLKCSVLLYQRLRRSLEIDFLSVQPSSLRRV
jgi:hypothetical protein